MGPPLLYVPDVARRNDLTRGPEVQLGSATCRRPSPRSRANGTCSSATPNSAAPSSFVVEARTAAGEDAVLKIALPGRAPEDSEARILIAAGGRGYVRALRHDARRRALLLERLGPQLLDLGLPVDAQIAIVCRTLAEARKTPPPARATARRRLARREVWPIQTSRRTETGRDDRTRGRPSSNSTCRPLARPTRPPVRRSPWRGPGTARTRCRTAPRP